MAAIYEAVPGADGVFVNNYNKYQLKEALFYLVFV